MRPIGLWSLASAALGALVFYSGPAAAACPAVTVTDNQGITGQFAQQFELEEFQKLASCTLSFSENPDIAALNARITGNPDLPPLAERLPAEPLVVAPYEEIGKHGGTFNVLSNATEAGTSDVLSIRHVNLVRFSDDLKALVPNVAKSWSWNDDFTELTFTLRKGHKWSDGAPFTAADVEFWFNDLILNTEIYETTPSLWIWEGEPAKVTAVDETTVKFSLPASVPGLLNRFAVSFIQPFQPKHFFEQFHIKYNPDANEMAKERGMESWVDLVNLYYGRSDWKDVPSPLLKGGADNVVPTLESHILVDESDKGRFAVANPYFHMVDTAGNQLPYVSNLDERYVPEQEVRNLKVVNGEVDYKMQNLFLQDFPLYKENEENGNYVVHLTPTLGEAVYYGFNTTISDDTLREVFNDVRFRRAMSLAIDREEILELVYLGQGVPTQATPAEPGTVDFLTDEHLTAYTEFDPDGARALLEDMGLKDSDGDGVRELPNGEAFVLQQFFANQGGPSKVHELVQGYWADVGVRANQREISSDEFRTKGQANELIISSWRNANRSGPYISQETFMLRPPFGDRWQPGNGFEWAVWKDTGGAQGIEPPDDVKKLFDLAEQFVLVPLGSDESNKIGKEIADIHMNNLWKIGLVGQTISPVVVTKRMGNFHPFTAATYDFYWAYAYRPQQWFFKSGD